MTELVTQVQSNTNSLNTDLSYGIQRLENIFDAVNSISFKDDITAFEEKIDEMLKSKKELADLAVYEGEKIITELSDEEIYEIFTLSA